MSHAQDYMRSKMKGKQTAMGGRILNMDLITWIKKQEQENLRQILNLELNVDER